MSLEGKVFIIAGASGALGQTVVPAFAAAGATTVSIDRAAPEDVPAGHHAVGGDVTDEQDVRRLIGEAQAKTGTIHGLVNLVGAFAAGPAVETDSAEWQRMLGLNLTAAFLLSKTVAPHLRAGGGGRLLHIGARAALDPFPGAAAYLVAKAGLLALIRTLSLELAGTGVTVNAVLPTTIDTPANRRAMPSGDPHRWVKRDAIARLLVFLASDDAGSISGALIPIGTP